MTPRPSVQGDDLVLTIDRSLQYETERALPDQILTSKAKGGMAIVMDSRTGEILAMANLGVDDAGAVAARQPRTWRSPTSTSPARSTR